MKPRVSTGYLTPQTDRKKKKNDDSVPLSESTNFNDDFFEKVMSDPIRRKLVLQIIDQEKDAIEAYKKKEEQKKIRENNPSPVNKFQKKYCESPTALLRRRALEQRDGGSDSLSEKSSRQSTPKSLTPNPSPIPFEKLLDGVIAYVEVKSKDQDRSAGAKILMRSMGALVKDTFTNDVTHVVFKDGSFSTYQKAKLLKKYLVSVLWLEAVRKYNRKVPEKDYPALGTSGHEPNISNICSQMQKEYEEVIREEVRRSLVFGTPLLSKKSSIERRKTLMTPIPTCSKLSQELLTSSFDQEVAEINRRHTLHAGRSTISTPAVPCFTPEMTSDDDSDIGVINGQSSKRARNKVNIHNFTTVLEEINENLPDNSSTVLDKSAKKDIYETIDMELTNLFNKENTNVVISGFDMEVTENISVPASSKETNNTNTPVKAKKSDIQLNDKKGNKNSNKTPKEIYRRRTLPLGHNNSSSDKSIKVTVDKTLPLEINASVESDKSTNISDDSLLKRLSTITNSTTSGSNDSSLKIYSKNLCISTDDKKICDMNNEDNTSTNMSSLHLSKETCMSSLYLSKETNSDKLKESSSKTDMSSLQMSSEKQTKSSNVLLKRVSEKSVNESTSSDSSEINLRRKSTRIVNAKSVKTNSEQTEESEASPKINVNSVENVTIRRKNKSNRKEIEENDKNLSNTKKNKNVVESEESSEDSPNKRRKRKLYNPDLSCSDILPIQNDDIERKQKRIQITKRKLDSVFINPILLVDSEDSDKSKSLLSSEESCDIELPTKNKTKNIKTKTIVRSSSADEQKQLMDEFLNKKNVSPKTPKRQTKKQLECKSENNLVNRRKSTRLVQKPKRLLSQDNLSPNRNTNRRSTLEFQSISQMSKRKLKIDPNKAPTIVCTKMHKSEVETFVQIVKKFGRFRVEDEVSKNTTHLVAGEPKRTINMLRALATGCWILKKDWLYKSLEEQKWLPEEDYEETDFSPAVQQCRIQRQAFGPTYSMDIFQNLGPIYIARSTTPRCSDLRELVELCKGKVVMKPEKADIIIGEYQEGKTCVKEIWILDSITFNKCKPLNRYLLSPNNKSLIV